MTNRTDHIATDDRAEGRQLTEDGRPSTGQDEARLSVVAIIALSVLALVGGWSFAAAAKV